MPEPEAEKPKPATIEDIEKQFADVKSPVITAREEAPIRDTYVRNEMAEFQKMMQESRREDAAMETRGLTDKFDFIHGMAKVNSMVRSTLAQGMAVDEGKVTTETALLQKKYLENMNVKLSKCNTPAEKDALMQKELNEAAKIKTQAQEGLNLASAVLEKQIKEYNELKRGYEKTPPTVSIERVSEAYKAICKSYYLAKEQDRYIKEIGALEAKLNALHPVQAAAATPTKPQSQAQGVEPPHTTVLIGNEKAKLEQVRDTFQGVKAEKLRYSETSQDTSPVQIANNLSKKGYDAKVYPNMVVVHLQPGQTMEKLQQDCGQQVKLLSEKEFKDLQRQQPTPTAPRATR